VGPESSGPGCHANAVCPPGAANARSYERWRHDSLGGRVIITRGHLKDWIPSRFLLTKIPRTEAVKYNSLLFRGAYFFVLQTIYSLDLCSLVRGFLDADALW
jgi:hypothetical protein